MSDDTQRSDDAAQRDDAQHDDDLRMNGVSGVTYTDDDGVTYRREEKANGDIVDVRVADGHEEPVLVTDGGVDELPNSEECDHEQTLTATDHDEAPTGAEICRDCGTRVDDGDLVTDGGHRDVERMTVEELREEYDPLGENRDAVSPGGHDRQMEIWNELRDRVDVEQPECPECGAQDWGQSPGEPKTCNGCGMPLGIDHADLAEDIQQAFNEILSGDGSDEKELVTDGGVDAEGDQQDADGLVTREEIEQYEEENDEMHPAFEVDHRPESVTFNDGRCLWDDCEDEDTVKAEVYGTSGEPEKTRVCEDHLDELRERAGVSVEVLES